VPEPQQLLKSVVPSADESIQSIAIRLAPFALVSTDELLRLGLKHSSLASLPTNPTAIDRLSKLGGFDSTEMKGRSIEPTECGFHIYQRQVPADWVSIDVRRLAPGALVSDGDDPFHRLAWQLVPLDCDPSTGEVLVDCCPRCHSRLTWTNINRVYTCSVCQFDMRESSPKCLSADRLEAARLLHDFLVGAGPTLPEPFDEADDITSCRAMEWLAYFVELSIGKSLQPSCRNAAMGIASLHQWPHSFDDTLIEIVKNSAGLISPSEKRQRRFVAQIIDAIVRAGTPLLHDVLLTRATERLGATAPSAASFDGQRTKDR
jgi:hypothetical protein